MVQAAAAGLAGLLFSLLTASAQDPASQPARNPHQEPERPVNRLAKESSPYLRQHRHNPVDWYPWGEEALRKAREEDKPIFLSIGYAACHWCHVMERESFENEEIAEVMNEHFVNIKVDREERPDLDEIYMAAVQAMTGSGGWPMSVWMTPELKPFFGGTYFPPDDRMGRPGFKRVLEHLAELWKNEREKVEKGSEELAEHLRGALAPQMDPGDPKIEYAAAAVRAAAERYDPQYGGFAQAPNFAPKFPHASELRVLLREHARSGDEQALEMATKTLTAMARGGMYDQLGGGFHRYSTDREWLVPHFEKMLYDNALLTPAYLEAYQVTGDEFYADVARETLDYLLREMQHERGGFYSTQDADSEGVEGKFFVWSVEEIDSLLGEDAELARLRWGVTEAGNWEHSNVLWAAMPLAEVAEQVGISTEEAGERLEKARRVLFEARDRRVHPGTDDKILAAWNGMAISAFARAYQTLGEERYLQAARQAADFVLSEMRRDGRLFRTWREGEAKLTGYLEDYAQMAEACLDLHESDFDPRWLAEAADLAARVREHFHDPADGNFFFTADDHEELLTRTKTVGESSTPSGIASATMAFLRLGLATGDEDRYAVGTGALRANHLWLERAPQACPTLVLAMQLHLSEPREVVVAGEKGDPRAAAMVAALRAEFPWHRVVLRVHGENRGALEELSPIVEGKEPVGGQAAAYVCRRGVCEAPVLDPEALQTR